MYSKLYKTEKEITTKQIAEHLFDFAEKVYEKSNGNVLEIPALKSEPKKNRQNLVLNITACFIQLLRLLHGTT